ncbi:MAG: penicillin-binding transpeptidase domain-containing protein [Pseudomonadota bacterium]
MRRAAHKKQDLVLRFRQRSIVLAAGFALLAMLLAGRAAQLQVVNREMLNKYADALHLRRMEVFAHRGNILDRHGQPLAISTPVDSIWANPVKLAPAIDRFGELATALDTSAENLMRLINRNMDKEFVYLRRQLRPDQVVAVDQLEMPGIDVLREYRRYYPAGEVAGHLVGFNDIDDKGQYGLEHAFDAALTGKPGAKRVLRDRYGRIVEDVESIRPPRPGEDLVTSIDLRIQYFAYRELKRAVQRHAAETGSMVIIDIQTGEVLAMVNQPAYNPNDRSQRTLKRYTNRAMTRILEPGSSIKPLIAAIALAEGAVSVDEMVNTSPGRIQVGAKEIEDHHDLGAINLQTILSRSSNVGMTMIAQRLDAEQLWRGLSRFGFGTVSYGGFPSESAGTLSHYADWREITQATVSYGYGLSVTPLQLAHAYAILGNRGASIPVTLTRVDEPPRAEQVLPADIAATVLELMEHVVLPGGTGTKAAIPGYRVAGKTGTSWKSARGGYSEQKYFSVFAGVVPVENPRLAAVVVIDEPTGGDYYGGDVAAPVFSEVMREALRLMALPPDDVPGLATQQLQAANP